MPVALFVSPHLDDVAFSCGGTLKKLVDRDWSVTLLTVFTASVANPAGFALRCQTDKGFASDIDYMEVRREEDRTFASFMGVEHIIHGPLKEAPHRGYESASELFAGVRENDDCWSEVAKIVNGSADAIKPDLVFGPQGIGHHVDHLQTIKGMLAIKLSGRICWYRDTPYIIRSPEASRAQEISEWATERFVSIGTELAAKLTGCAQYQSQLEFQFAGETSMRLVLDDFHRSEGIKSGNFRFAERFLTQP